MLGRIFMFEVTQLIVGQYGFPEPQASALCLLDGLKDSTISYSSYNKESSDDMGESPQAHLKLDTWKRAY